MCLASARSSVKNGPSLLVVNTGLTVFGHPTDVVLGERMRLFHRGIKQRQRIDLVRQLFCVFCSSLASSIKYPLIDRSFSLPPVSPVSSPSFSWHLLTLLSFLEFNTLVQLWTCFDRIWIKIPVLVSLWILICISFSLCTFFLHGLFMKRNVFAVQSPSTGLTFPEGILFP